MRGLPWNGARRDLGHVHGWKRRVGRLEMQVVAGESFHHEVHRGSAEENGAAHVARRKSCASSNRPPSVATMPGIPT